MEVLKGPTQLARFPGLRFYDAMRGATIFILLGITAAVAYSVGRTDSHVSNPPVAVATAPTVKPVPFGGPFSAAPAPAPAPSSPTPSKADLPDKSARPDAKR